MIALKFLRFSWVPSRFLWLMNRKEKEKTTPSLVTSIFATKRKSNWRILSWHHDAHAFESYCPLGRWLIDFRYT